MMVDQRRQSNPRKKSRKENVRFEKKTIWRYNMKKEVIWIHDNRTKSPKAWEQCCVTEERSSAYVMVLQREPNGKDLVAIRNKAG